ncbi:MAG: DUF2971 domain-containing protein [Rikenellaceae bacterium]|nr:DUF2971 domain-containing protein [Rikenellaceae bacterium]
MGTPDILYHYTSMEAFYAIMKDVKSAESVITFWASHVSFMNDPGEYMYLANEVDKLLLEQSLFNDTNGSEELTDHFKRDVHVSDLLNGQPTIFSLSEKKDALPMWQAYAQNGKGIAIGFDRTELENIGNGWSLRKCNYLSNKELEETGIIEEIKTCVKTESLGDQEIDLLALYRALEKRISIKHPAFSHEEEWRLAKSDVLNYEYRERNGLIIPYCKLELKASMIKEVWIGPTAYPLLSEKSLQLFLHSRNISYELYKSFVPYANL